MVCLYKKTFLKDLSKLPLNYRERIEKLVFEEIPKYDSLFKILDIKLMKGHKDYYRIRVGEYRIGCRIEKDSKVIFYRVKSRSDIYKLFP
jgi:mRNA-degrading endonuclease RelE of RelBE toxin-antitoxin system